MLVQELSFTWPEYLGNSERSVLLAWPIVLGDAEKLGSTVSSQNKHGYVQEASRVPEGKS